MNPDELPEAERPVRNSIAAHMEGAESRPVVAEDTDPLSFADSLDSFQKYAEYDSDTSKAMNAIVQAITIDEAAHAEAFTCEVFGISMEEHDELVEWTRAGAQGEAPIAVTKLAMPVAIDERLGQIIRKYDMHSKPARVWVLNRLFSRLAQIQMNAEAAQDV